MTHNGLTVSDESFYLVQLPSEDRLVNTQDDAVAILENSDVEIGDDDGNVSVLTVSYGDEDWTIKELPWKNIALALLDE